MKDDRNPVMELLIFFLMFVGIVYLVWFLSK